MLYSFHLPLFFIISGYLFSYKDDFKSLLIRKSKSYLIPYICCMLINTIILYFMGEILPFYNIKQFFLQIRFPTLWFLAALYGGILLFWIIFRICKEKFGIIFGACGLISVIAFEFEEYFKIPLPWNFDTALVIQLYLAIGYGIRKFRILDLYNQQKKAKKIVEIFLLVLISIVCTSINFSLCQESFMMAYSEYGVILLTFPASCLMSFGVLFFATYIGNFPFLEWIGKNSFCFFAFHKTLGIIPIYYICSLAGVCNRNIRAIVAFMGTLIICSIVHVFIADSKFRFIIGK